MRTASILIFVVVTGTGGEICLTHAMKLLGEVHDFHPRAILSFVLRALRVGWLWLGVLLMTASFFSFLAMLSWFPVSFVIWRWLLARYFITSLEFIPHGDSSA
jgi:hypothetical protein